MVKNWESNFNKWSKKYSNVTSPSPNGDTESYKIGIEALKDCKTIEDWGCGRGWFKQFCTEDQAYIGVDGSDTPFVDKKVDLEDYTSDVDGIFMRHVLEHNWGWEGILKNALKSFNKTLVVVLFTPWSKRGTKLIVENSNGEDSTIPDLSLSRPKFLSYLKGYNWEEIEVDSPSTVYGSEIVVVINKED